MTFLRPRLAVALMMTIVVAAASSLIFVGIARAGNVQSGAQLDSRFGLSWVPGTTFALANSKSIEASFASASTLTLASSVSEQAKIFVLSSGSSDAILIKNSDWYGIVDGGEDADLSDGSDPRYLMRSDTAATMSTSTEWLLQQLDSQGVNDTSVVLYLGTHAHPDHIANTDETICRYYPKVILGPEYPDAWIADENGLWDNQYVYDHLVNVTNWAVDSYGATFIQRLQGFDTYITLDDADIQLIPFDSIEYYRAQGTTDANLMGWGVKTTANGHTAFLTSDLMSTESGWETPNGPEDRITDEVGEVDMLKAGYRGAKSSNSAPFMAKLRLGAIVQTGQADDSPDRLSFLMLRGGTQ